MRGLREIHLQRLVSEAACGDKNTVENISLTVIAVTKCVLQNTSYRDIR